MKGGEKNLDAIYRFLDCLIDPPPKELRKGRNKAAIIRYYESQDEDYKVYKKLKYRKFLIKSVLFFALGLFSGFLLKFL